MDWAMGKWARAGTLGHFKMAVSGWTIFRTIYHFSILACNSKHMPIKIPNILADGEFS
jgi:hypothetical protein